MSLGVRQREREIVDATRALFDARGLQDAPIDEVAKAVGLSRALIYRHFSSKEELFTLTVTHYLDQLDEELRSAAAEAAEPVAQLRRVTEAYADFCLAYPAFLDCALSLMRRPADELRERVSDATWIRLGQGMAGGLSVITAVLVAGNEAGVFAVEDPDLTANQLYTSALGTMHLARIRVGVREAAPGVPEAFAIDPARVREEVVRAALRIVAA